MKSKDNRQSDKLLRNSYKTDNKWGIPLITRDEINFECVELLGYDHIGRSKVGNENRIIHFFVDDYKMNAVYDIPESKVEKLARFKAIMTPDYSLYSDMPLAVQLDNVFKNRWCGAYWQDHGLKVIPTIGWGTEDSFDFCFLGVEKKCNVAVSTVGSRRYKREFLKGYNAMMEKIEPEAIICYGKPFPEMEGQVIYVPYLETIRGCI